MRLLWDDRSNFERNRISYYCVGAYRVRLYSSLEPFYIENRAIVKTSIEVLNSMFEWKTLLTTECIYADLEPHSLSTGDKTKKELIDKTERLCLEKVIMLLDGA